MVDSFRHAFFDTLQDLCDITNGPKDASQIVWKAEYLTRGGRWYHYYGIKRNGQPSSVAHEFDAMTGSSKEVDPNTYVFTLLDFATNGVIGAYGGRRTTATEILQEAETSASACSPEVVRIAIEARSQLHDGRPLMTVTDIAFLGFQEEPDGGFGERLTRSQDIPSPKWCRGRHVFGELPTLART